MVTYIQYLIQNTPTMTQLWFLYFLFFPLGEKKNIDWQLILSVILPVFIIV